MQKVGALWPAQLRQKTALILAENVADFEPTISYSI
jgi:hypothetical protein